VKSDAEIGKYLDEEGRITVWPSKRSRKLAVLRYLVSKFDIGTEYAQAEVNEILERSHTFGDAPLLRRELFECRLLDRTRDGSRYWVLQNG
jgi:chloramphenicol O-acetyltransferase type A